MIPALNAAAIVVGLAVPQGAGADQACTASITLSNSHVTTLETLSPQVELPNREDLNLPDLSGAILALVSAAGAKPGSAPPPTTAVYVNSHSYFRAPLGPVIPRPVPPDMIDLSSVTKQTKNGYTKLSAGVFRFRFTYIEGYSEAEGHSPAILCTVYSAAFRVDRDLLWSEGVFSRKGAEQPNNSVNAPVRPVAPLAVASVAPVRPARYALR